MIPDRIRTTLVDFQLDAQNSYLFIYIIHLLKSSTCFEHYPAHLLSFSTGAQDCHLQRVTIPEAAYIQLRRGPPEVSLMIVSRLGRKK